MEDYFRSQAHLAQRLSSGVYSEFEFKELLIKKYLEFHDLINSKVITHLGSDFTLKSYEQERALGLINKWGYSDFFFGWDGPSSNGLLGNLAKKLKKHNRDILEQKKKFGATTGEEQKRIGELIEYHQREAALAQQELEFWYKQFSDPDLARRYIMATGNFEPFKDGRMIKENYKSLERLMPGFEELRYTDQSAHLAREVVFLTTFQPTFKSGKTKDMLNAIKGNFMDLPVYEQAQIYPQIMENILEGLKKDLSLFDPKEFKNITHNFLDIISDLSPGFGNVHLFPQVFNESNKNIATKTFQEAMELLIKKSSSFDDLINLLPWETSVDYEFTKQHPIPIDIGHRGPGIPASLGARIFNRQIVDQLTVKVKDLFLVEIRNAHSLPEILSNFDRLSEVAERIKHSMVDAGVITNQEWKKIIYENFEVLMTELGDFKKFPQLANLNPEEIRVLLQARYFKLLEGPGIFSAAELAEKLPLILGKTKIEGLVSLQKILEIENQAGVRNISENSLALQRLSLIPKRTFEASKQTVISLTNWLQRLENIQDHELSSAALKVLSRVEQNKTGAYGIAHDFENSIFEIHYNALTKTITDEQWNDYEYVQKIARQWGSDIFHLPQLSTYTYQHLSGHHRDAGSIFKGPLSAQLLFAWEGYQEGIKAVPTFGDRPWATADEILKGWQDPRTFSEMWSQLLANVNSVTDLIDENPESLARIFSEASGNLLPSQSNDIIFDFLWNLRHRPEIKKYLLNPKIVHTLTLKDRALELAKWQLDEIFGVSNLADEIKKGMRAAPGVEEVRPLANEVFGFIQEQFSEIGTLRDQIIEYFEKKTSTSLAENKLLRKIRINGENWVGSDQLRLLSLPSELTKAFKVDTDRIDFIKHLIGAIDRPPKGWTDLRDEIVQLDKQNLKKGAILDQTYDWFVQNFRSSDMFSQNFFLQNFLGAGGVDLENVENVKELEKLILGKYNEEKVLKKLFNAYVAALPPGERSVVLSHILSSFLKGNGAEKGVSLKKILEGMGPFGIRAGQFLRSSGLASKEVLEELDGFFDQALPPLQNKIYDDLVEIFGPDLKGVKKVHGLVGAGSLNYAVRLTYEDPQTKSVSEIIVRIQRSEAIGQVANENGNWERAIKTLLADEDPEVRSIAQSLEEAREASMRTLGADGIEFDMGHERAAYGAIKNSYQTSVLNPATGLRIEVVKSREDVLEIVPTHLHSKVSILDYIPNTRLNDLPEDLRKAVAKQIVEAELKALFTNGVFDPDGHPGNWLIDLQGGRLVRIDYAQAIQIDPTNLKRYKSIIESFFIPQPSAKNIRFISNNLSQMFDLPKFTGDLYSAVSRILTDPEMPPATNPQMRVMFLRTELEKYFIAQGNAGAKVRLKDDLKGMLSSVSRIVKYQEEIGTSDFVVLITKYLPIQLSWKNYFSSLTTADGRAMAKKILTDRFSSFYSTYFPSSDRPLPANLADKSLDNLHSSSDAGARCNIIQRIIKGIVKK